MRRNTYKFQNDTVFLMLSLLH